MDSLYINNLLCTTITTLLVLATPKVINYENFKSRRNHKDFFIEMTVSFDTDSLTEAHNLSHQITKDIKAKFGKQVQVIIHLEPRTEF